MIDKTSVIPAQAGILNMTLATNVTSSISSHSQPITEDMTEIKIPVLDLKPQYKSEVQAAINRGLESGRFIMGPDVKLFEQEVAEYVGVKHSRS